MVGGLQLKSASSSRRVRANWAPWLPRLRRPFPRTEVAAPADVGIKLTGETLFRADDKDELLLVGRISRRVEQRIMCGSLADDTRFISSE